MCFRKTFSKFIKQAKTDYEYMIVLQIGKHSFATDRNIFFLGLLYECESSVYGVTQNGYGIEPLEQCVMDLYDKFDNFDIIVCGDLNSRTGSHNQSMDMVTDPLCTDSKCFQEKKSRDSQKVCFEINSSIFAASSTVLL